MRRAATVPSALADLAGALTRPAPQLPSRVLRAARKAAETARAAVLEEIAEHGVKATATALGVSESTLHLWRAPGGWLRIEPEP